MKPCDSALCTLRYLAWLLTCMRLWERCGVRGLSVTRALCGLRLRSPLKDRLHAKAHPVSGRPSPIPPTACRGRPDCLPSVPSVARPKVCQSRVHVSRLLQTWTLCLVSKSNSNSLVAVSPKKFTSLAFAFLARRAAPPSPRWVIIKIICLRPSRPRCQPQAANLPLINRRSSDL